MMLHLLTALSMMTNTPDGSASVFIEEEVAMFQTSVPCVSQSLPILAKEITFLEYEAGVEFDWHTSRIARFVMILEGELELELRDGSKKTYRAGDVFIANDLEGSGHRTKTLTKGRSVAVELN